jgi:hypothetical protein
MLTMFESNFLVPEGNADVIGAFLSSCKMRGVEIELAKWAADRLLCLEPVNYLLMSNTFTAAGAWNEVANLRSVLRIFHSISLEMQHMMELTTQLVQKKNYFLHHQMFIVFNFLRQL